jgi:DNA-binding NarL/FixJ family response regulator
LDQPQYFYNVCAGLCCQNDLLRDNSRFCVAEGSNSTTREQEILHALAKGLSYKQIAAELFISVETVRTYLRNIYEKLQVHSKVEALNKVFPSNPMG